MTKWSAGGKKQQIKVKGLLRHTFRGSKDHLDFWIQEYFIYHLWINYSGWKDRSPTLESLWDLLKNFKIAMLENLKIKFPQYHVASHLPFCINGQLHLLSSKVMARAMHENVLWKRILGEDHKIWTVVPCTSGIK